MRTELGDRDFFGTCPPTEESRDLGEGRRARTDLKELKKPSRRSFGVPADVKSYAGTPTRTEVLHPMRNGAATDPQLDERRFPAGGPSYASIRTSDASNALGHGLLRGLRPTRFGRDRRDGRGVGAAVRLPSAITARSIPSTKVGSMPWFFAILRARRRTRFS